MSLQSPTYIHKARANQYAISDPSNDTYFVQLTIFSTPYAESGLWTAADKARRWPILVTVGETGGPTGVGQFVGPGTVA